MKNKKHRMAESRVKPNKIMAAMVRIMMVGGQGCPSARVELGSDGNCRFKVQVRSEFVGSVAVSVVIGVLASDVRASAMGKDNV